MAKIQRAQRVVYWMLTDVYDMSLFLGGQDFDEKAIEKSIKVTPVDDDWYNVTMKVDNYNTPISMKVKIIGNEGNFKIDEIEVDE